MNNLIKIYSGKKKENRVMEVIDEIADIFEYGDLENSICLELSQLIINDVVEVENVELQESMLNAISNAAIYKNVSEYLNLDTLLDNIDKFNHNNLEYIFTIISFSHKQKYIPILERYVDSTDDNISENAKLSLNEIKSKVDFF